MIKSSEFTQLMSDGARIRAKSMQPRGAGPGPLCRIVPQASVVSWVAGDPCVPGRLACLPHTCSAECRGLLVQASLTPVSPSQCPPHQPGTSHPSHAEVACL